MKEVLTDANFPRDAEGHTYHVATKLGQVANRIITVGDHVRARRIAELFDGGKAIFEKSSQRLFLTLTGTYKGTPITVVAIGMGFSAVDFFLRECRAVVQGEMIVVRLGSCGSIDESLRIGTVVVPFQSVGVTRNWDYFSPELSGKERSALEPYLITQPIACDKEVHDALLKSLEASTVAPARSDVFGGEKAKAVGNTTNASADSFYAAQGRNDPAFSDANDTLIDDLKKRRPGVATFEMETYALSSLAACANADGSGRIRTGAVQMIFADRNSSGVITPTEVELLELWAGKSVCDALISLPIPEELTQKEGVWSQASTSS
ncbi:unnamed protein product [Tilletia controversa]|uniref:Nucleoside phosphorylase domain-containing protein n=3 Tax=Tilletia TaxID=13289 RepID=A0A8X7MU82_9BASI|nr:hypothetical protein CF336_g2881 [Tilletia laevis]KAE8203702.1 hypothetical protein CF328_g1509 [Tilletia controversa]KAE8264210.1 hypothetical protein A4X03_0g1105 [Tilletia caries]KAE8206185.1 hypothetical protein CF335_g2046 [Tilletia laevis]KAE8249158.1 hypothetical protein A4X06_0g3358 [Tilletia controversa]